MKSAVVERQEYVLTVDTLKQLAALVTDDALERMALAKVATFKGFSAAVREVMNREMGVSSRPSARTAAPLAVSKMAIERPMLPFIDNVTDPLGKTLMKDEVQNDLVLHSKIHAIFLELLGIRSAAADAPIPLEALTSTIYAEAFLTPLDDPFMGLAPPDVFTAIPPSAEKTATGAIP